MGRSCWCGVGGRLNVPCRFFFFSFSQMLAADEALVVKAGGPTLVRPGLSADVYSGKAVMMKAMGLSLRARGGVS